MLLAGVFFFFFLAVGVSVASSKQLHWHKLASPFFLYVCLFPLPLRRSQIIMWALFVIIF